MKVKLDSGREVVFNDLTVDERDELLDSVSYEYKADGSMLGVKMMHTTMTKWMRTCIDGDISDDFLKSLSLDEKTEIFTKLQGMFFVGEGKASK